MSERTIVYNLAANMAVFDPSDAAKLLLNWVEAPEGDQKGGRYLALVYRYAQVSNNYNLLFKIIDAIAEYRRRVNRND